MTKIPVRVLRTSVRETTIEIELDEGDYEDGEAMLQDAEALALEKAHNTDFGQFAESGVDYELEAAEPVESAGAPSDEWEHIGNVCVDTGMLLMCDPSAIDADWVTGRSATLSKVIGQHQFSHLGCCSATSSKKGGGTLSLGKKTEADHGVVCTTGHGDGLYPVFVRRENHHGVMRIMDVMVRFS